MFFQMMEAHSNQWRLFDYNTFNGIMPMHEAEDLEIKHFLVDQDRYLETKDTRRHLYE